MTAVLLILPKGTVLVAITHLFPWDEEEGLLTDEKVIVQNHLDWKARAGKKQRADGQAGSPGAGEAVFP